MRLPTSKGIISGLILIHAAMPSHSNAADALLDEARAGHLAARQTIRTFAATFVAEIELPSKSTMAQGRYWRVGDVARIQMGQEKQATADFQVKDGEVRLVRRWDWSGSGPRKYKASRSPANAFLQVSDVWREMMIDLPSDGGGRSTYERMLECSSEAAPSRRVRQGSREFIVVSRKEVNPAGGETRFNLWHDVGCNYLIRKMEVPDRNMIGVVTVTEFSEPQPGVFVPLRVRRESFEDGTLKSARVTYVKDVRVNEPIPAASMSLPAIPNGTILDDTIQGTNGPVGPDWRPIGPQRKAEGRTLIAGSASSESSVWDAPSTSEPASSGWWVTATSSGLAALLMGYILVNRLRGNRAEPVSGRQ